MSDNSSSSSDGSNNTDKKYDKSLATFWKKTSKTGYKYAKGELDMVELRRILAENDLDSKDKISIIMFPLKREGRSPKYPHMRVYLDEKVMKKEDSDEHGSREIEEDSDPF